MCVVDRRDEAMAYASGNNRAKLQEALIDADEKHAGELESSAAPAPVMADSTPEELPEGYEGVPIVARTPGPQTLLKLLFARVWGVEI